MGFAALQRHRHRQPTGTLLSLLASWLAVGERIVHRFRPSPFRKPASLPFFSSIMLRACATALWARSGPTASRPSPPSFAASQAASALASSSGFQQLRPPSQPQQMQQVRYRWTKAKKKRFERYQRRQELEARGIALPKPPYYFPKDTPVVAAIPKEERIAEARRADAQAAEELRRRQDELQGSNRSQPLRHGMDAARLTVGDRVRQLLDLRNGNQSQVVQAQKQRAMELFQLRPADTGSSAVQVVALTARIQQVSTHLRTHRKDRHGKRGLDALYVRRRKLLDYMERKDFESYRKVVKTLGLVRR